MGRLSQPCGEGGGAVLLGRAEPGAGLGPDTGNTRGQRRRPAELREAIWPRFRGPVWTDSSRERRVSGPWERVAAQGPTAWGPAPPLSPPVAAMNRAEILGACGPPYEHCRFESNYHF